MTKCYTPRRAENDWGRRNFLLAKSDCETVLQSSPLPAGAKFPLVQAWTLSLLGLYFWWGPEREFWPWRERAFQALPQTIFLEAKMVVKKSGTAQDGAAALSLKMHEAAYERWQSNGMPRGTALDDWLYAESLVLGVPEAKKKRSAVSRPKRTAAGSK